MIKIMGLVCRILVFLGGVFFLYVFVFWWVLGDRRDFFIKRLFRVFSLMIFGGLGLYGVKIGFVN